jgi:hypothetical protein
VENEIIRGYGNGFTAFIGLSKINSIWIADWNEKSKSLLEEEVNFNEGDCLIVKYDTLHAGAANNTGYDTFKTFSDVFTHKQQANNSQLWFVDGGRFSKFKPPEIKK